MRHSLPALLLLAVLAPACSQGTLLGDGEIWLSSTGPGTIVSSPEGLSCASPCSTSLRLPGGTQLTLSAVPDEGQRFEGWSGACSGNGDCVLTVNGPALVSATFGPALSRVEARRMGPGFGRVTSFPAGIDCPEQCAADFPRGTVVKLSATAMEGSRFAGWSGPCTGLSFCSVNADDGQPVFANFVLEPQTLSVSVGTGGGRVVSDPEGINCPPACDTPLPLGAQVTLSAQPEPGASFAGWESPVCAGSGACSLTMGGATHVAARFVYPLTVSALGAGDGLVVSVPAGIACGAACSAHFAPAAGVTLRATPGPTSVFAGWTGACVGTADCGVVVNNAVAVSARFEPRLTTLAVQRAGNGSGTVVSTPAGVECGAACSALLRVGTPVTLVATPAVGSRFVGWSGACTGTAECALTLGDATLATATFELLRYTVAVDRRGAGTVTSDAGGVYCGVTCSLVLEHGSRVTFTATPDSGAAFTGFAGPCQGTAACTVLVDGPKTVVAQFNWLTYPLTVSRAGNGGGSVVSTPAAIDCGATCASTFNHGSVVTLVAEPDARSTFAGWTGACAGRSACVVTLTEARSAVATFTANRYALTVEKVGGGSGSIRGGLGAVDCGDVCGATFQAGATVTLTATAASDSLFTGWSGAGCSGTGDCTVSVEGPRTVTAVLVKKKFVLTVHRDGPGTVASATPGLYCGTACDEIYDAGTVVSLTATPDAGANFLGWSGACSGTDTRCQVSLDAARSVSAAFSRTQYPLAVSVTGAGLGSVTSTPSGLACGATCTAGFDFGTVVTLTALPADGAEFAGWTGACVGAGVCTLTLDVPKNVTASFALRRYTLAVERAGTGAGVVRSAPVGVECGTACSASFDAGTSLTLTALPDVNSLFTGWTGACAGVADCMLTLRGNSSAVATFTRKKQVLTVSRTGPGMVASVPTRLYCGSTCQDAFDSGTQVTLTATPDAGAAFLGWGGACAGKELSCVVAMSAARSVSATFGRTQPPLTVAVTGTGLGWVTSTPGGITCGTTCSAAFDFGTVVTLSAVPAEGSDFTGWTGACAGAGVCTLSVDAARNATAAFTLRRYTLGVERAGTGAGVVRTAPAGVDCGATCSATFDAGTTLTLTALPDVDSVFSGWTGACAGVADCVLTPRANSSAVAVFTRKKHLLTVTRTGPGLVASMPTRLYCGSTCQDTFDSGTQVTLTATPDAGAAFIGWGGACTGIELGCVVAMSAARGVSATFSRTQHPIAVSVSGTGAGLVTSTPGGITCGTTCSAGFDFGTVVTLSAVPVEGSDFTGWAGACTGAGVCTVGVDTAKSVTATFVLRRYTLGVERAGTGAGVVRTAPVGVDCGATCSATFDAGTALTLTALPDVDSVFSGWTGACAGVAECTLTLRGNSAAVATFTRKKHLLTVTRTGPGTVASVPTRLYCGSTCQDTFDSGTQVTLTATPDAGATFVGWGGVCSGTALTCVVTVSAAHGVSATFAPAVYALSLTLSGTGVGSVSSTPAGVSCGATCSAGFDAPTVVTLSATAASGSAFAGWSGACSGTGVCTVTMTQARAASARFVLLQYVLAVEKTGTGTGTVSSSPVGLACGATCSAAFDFGTQVTLSALPTADSLFAGWTGACSGTGDCTLGINAAKSAAAAFVKRKYVVSLTRTGPGTVVSMPARLYCGNACDDTFDAGTLLSLTATPDAGAAFTGWSGGCTGTAVSCAVTVDGAKTISAHFVRLENTASVTLAGNGQGTVTSSPAGLTCGTTCSASFAADATVALSASPEAGSYFAGWSGGCSGSGVCVLPMTDTRAVTATFTKSRFVLSLERSGAGGGVVHVAPGAPDCAGACSATFDSGTVVTLTAEAAADSVFAGWAGVGCVGLGACSVTMDAARVVTASFTKKKYAFSLARTGPGLVTSLPARLYCGSACDDTFDAGTLVTLTAAPEVGATFLGWGGACTGTALTCAVTVDGAKAVTAAFTAPDATLSVARTGTGSGTVASAPSGISCGNACSTSYPPLTDVVLTATADAGSTFAGWTAPCAGTGTCTLRALGHLEVTAIFLRGSHTLLVSKAGTGSGTVTSAPAGVACGGSCAAAFDAGTSVTLTAAADASSSFSGWSGACSGTQLTCVLTVDGTKSATATFKRLTQDLTVTLHGPGTIVSSPGGIYCGQGCVATFDSGADVLLRAVPDAGAAFREWGGACTGSGTCTVNLATAQSVVAYFGYVLSAPLASAGGSGSPGGGGQVASSDQRIACSGATGACSYIEDPGTVVTLTATPATDATLLGWSGDCAASLGNTCQVTMGGAKDATARFGYTLTTAKAGTGGGTVSALPGDLSCGTDCSETYLYGTSVTLTATPDSTSDFIGWSGSCQGLGACVVTLSAARSVTATFTRRTHTLTVGRSGTGGGSVASSPAGIDCGGGGSCLATYDELTPVTLTAHPDATSTFAGWSGGCGGTGTCQVTMFTAASVTASFTRITYELVVTPAAGGSISSSPAGLVCGATCSATYVVGTVVTLTPSPLSGALFAGWSGACSGSGACLVHMPGPTAVGATFTYHLAVGHAGNGAGTVSSVSGIACGATCGLDAPASSVVTLTAAPDGTSDFTGWSGGGCSGAGACVVTMDAVYTVTATFTRRAFGLDVTIVGAGGSVASSPAGIACASGICSASFTAGAVVGLTATAGSGATFAGWSGDCSGTGACSVTMSAAHAVTATFTVPQHSLQLSFSGSGSVYVSPPDATCSNGACNYSLAGGTVVTLTATPTAGWTFGVWSGCDSVAGNTCTVTMNQNRTISTGFNNNSFTLAASFQGSNGTITSNPAGINCGSVCSGSFAVGATVRLIAVPGSSDYFVSSWTGCTSFSGATCDITMNSNQSVTAVFSPSPTGWVNACEEPGMTRIFATGGSYQGGYDDNEQTANIGFSFSYYGAPYTVAHVSTNAVISFDTGSAAYSNTALPGSGMPARSLYVFWDDLYTTLNNGICTATVGAVGARQFVVTWSKLGFFGSTDNTSLTFSAILHEGTNAIEYIYYDMSSPQGTRGLGSDATIGLQGPTSTHQYSYNASVITNGQTIHYDAP